MNTTYKYILSLALSFAYVIIASLVGRAIGGSASAQTIGEAFYIYRNDGGFNAFFRAEVDSMTYSCFDLDSLLHDDIVTQVVYTEDSVYRIPLASIDSVSFVTPETKYKSGVKVIEGEIRNYVLSSDGLTIRFKSDTPSSLLPRVGDKLVTTEVSETFFAGFLGKVECINNDETYIVVNCSAVGLDEVFDEFIYISGGNASDTQVKGQEGRRNISKSWEASYSPGKFPIPLTAPFSLLFKKDPKGDLAYEVTTEANISITPTFRSKVILLVSPKLGTVVSIDLSEEDLITEDLMLSGAIDNTPEFSAGPVPIFSLGVPFLYFCGEIGAFLRAHASVTLENHWKQTFRYIFHYEADSRTLFIPRISYNSINLENEHSGELLVKGDFSVGVYVELGVVFMAKYLLSAGGRAEAGIKAGGDVMLYKKDMESALRSTDVYKTLKGSDVHVRGFWNVGLQGQWLKWGASHSFEALTGEKTIARYSIVPDFSDMRLVRFNENATLLQSSGKVSGNCLPQDLGFTLFERQTLEEGKSLYSQSGYKGPSAALFASYPNMLANKHYEVYPTIKLFGLDALTILAEPKAEEEWVNLCPDENHPHMIDLGIGKKWACCNVGATKPEDYGDYYPKNAPFKMPSGSDFIDKLLTCSYTSTTINNVKGYLFTGKNGNNIFLPAAGRKKDGKIQWRGYGCYWSNSGFVWDRTSTGEGIQYGQGFFLIGDNERWLGGVEEHENVEMSVRIIE